MDATASSGGPGTFLFQVVTGRPTQIARHSTGLLAKATQFTSMLDEFTKAAEQLKTVWSGQASQSAVQQITGSLQAFEKIIQVVQNGARLLGVSGTLVQSAQTAYKSVVGSVNPTVASLMSNPWTYSAAVALSTATSASLRAFIMAIEGLLQALGVGQLGAEIATLAGVVSQIEQLASGAGAAAAATGSVPTTQTISATPLSVPATVPPVASPTGQQAAGTTPGITDYTPPALRGFGAPTAGTIPTGTTPAGAAGTTPGLTPSIDPANSWIAVDPSTAAATSTPAALPATAPPGTDTPLTGGEQVSVTSANGVTTTVSVPEGQAADVSIGTDGSVRVTP
ncbi:MAG TPA: hypothetical protein VHV74_12595 [Pseudonocardiaceae bacterium]|nr:hypothetical protein [Pseudonocardiaceae bacterium]